MYLPSIQPSSTLGICLCMNLRSNWWGKCSNTDWLYHLQNKLQAKSDMIRQPHKLCQQGCHSSCLGTLWCTAEMHHSCSKCWLGKWWRTGKRWSQRRWETGNLDIILTYLTSTFDYWRWSRPNIQSNWQGMCRRTSWKQCRSRTVWGKMDILIRMSYYHQSHSRSQGRWARKCW